MFGGVRGRGELKNILFIFGIQLSVGVPAPWYTEWGFQFLDIQCGGSTLSSFDIKKIQM